MKAEQAESEERNKRAEGSAPAVEAGEDVEVSDESELSDEVDAAPEADSEVAVGDGDLFTELLNLNNKEQAAFWDDELQAAIDMYD